MKRYCIAHNLLCVLLTFQLESIRFKREAIIFYEICNNSQVSAHWCWCRLGCLGPTVLLRWLRSPAVETPAGGGGEEQSCRVECFAYNKHSREILLILLDIFPMYVRVLIKHFSQKPSEAGVFFSTKFMIFLLDSLVSTTNKNKDWKCIYPVAICKMSLVFMRHKTRLLRQKHFSVQVPKDVQ